jgi:hypothetical protein
MARKPDMLCSQINVYQVSFHVISDLVIILKENICYVQV